MSTHVMRTLAAVKEARQPIGTEEIAFRTALTLPQVRKVIRESLRLRRLASVSAKQRPALYQLTEQGEKDIAPPATESLVQHAVRTQPKSVFELADYLP